MTADEACELLIEAINFAAYRETGTSLYDTDKNRLFGSERWNSGRLIVKPSPWPEGDFEGKMATLLDWASMMNRSNAAFLQALRCWRMKSRQWVGLSGVPRTARQKARISSLRLCVSVVKKDLLKARANHVGTTTQSHG